LAGVEGVGGGGGGGGGGGRGKMGVELEVSPRKLITASSVSREERFESISKKKREGQEST